MAFDASSPTQPSLSSADPEWSGAAWSARARKRSTWILCAIFLLYGALGVRLFKLQCVKHQDSEKTAAHWMSSSQVMSVRRGAILDSSGRELAVSVRTQGCAIDPALVEDPQLVVSALTGAFSLSNKESESLLGRIEQYGILEGLQKESEQATGQRMQGVNAPRFIWVRRRVDSAEVAMLKELKLKGVLFPDGWARRYPQDGRACHVIGFSNIDEEGIEGIELSCQKSLIGTPGKLGSIRDARARQLVLDETPLVEPKEGLSLKLSIDSYVQSVAERELAKVMEAYSAKRAVAVVMDPYTGDLLAVAATPGYDPNTPTSADPSNRLNPMIAAIYEPGSAFKPFIVAAALERKLITPEKVFDCENGSWNLGFRVLHDTHSYGMLTVSQIIEKSSNIGACKVAALLGPNQMHNYLSGFGLGRRTGIELRGELPGQLRPVSQWNVKFAMTSIPMGQEVCVTPLQLTASFGALINGGYLVRPRLIKEYINADGTIERQIPVVARNRVISEETSKTMRGILEKVVTEGTGKKALIDEYTVGGKTGTAQIAEHGKYQPNKYVATFVGFAPVEAPRLVVTVSVTEPKGVHYGGTVAAPAVKEIIRDTLIYMNVPRSPKAINTAVASRDAGGND